MENTNEVFAELLDEYLDIKAIEEKKEYDSEELAKEEKQMAVKNGLTGDYTISIYRFLRDYLHASADRLTFLNLDFDLRGLKYLGEPTLRVMPIDGKVIKTNPELVEQEYLLQVRDSKHNQGVYINPNFIEKLLHDQGKTEFKLKEFESIEDMTDEEIEEYQELLQDKEDNEITKRLIRKAHKEKKFIKLKELMEKSDKND